MNMKVLPLQFFFITSNFLQSTTRNQSYITLCWVLHWKRQISACCSRRTLLDANYKLDHHPYIKMNLCNFYIINFKICTKRFMQIIYWLIMCHQIIFNSWWSHFLHVDLYIIWSFKSSNCRLITTVTFLLVVLLAGFFFLFHLCQHCQHYNFSQKVRCSNNISEDLWWNVHMQQQMKSI